jgi:xylan 1,4-beta-xylosidase
MATCRPVFAQEQIQIDATAQTTPFPHFWEGMFGSGRAILTPYDIIKFTIRSIHLAADLYQTIFQP